MAKRDLTAELAAEFRKTGLTLLALVEIEFATATMRMWNGYGKLQWGSEEWLGMGTLGGISSVTESSDIAANGITLSLSGIPVDLLADSLSEVRPDKKAKVWFGAMDANGKVLVDPYLAFQGFCDVPTVTDEQETCTISLTCEPRWLDRRARVWRYTQQDQDILSPGDTGFRFLKDIDKPVYWGKSMMSGGGGGGGGCFGGAVPIKVPLGWFAMHVLPAEFTIVNLTGEHRARLVVHENWKGWTRKIGGTEHRPLLVTVDHPMGQKGDVIADEKYSTCERVWFEGTVYTLHVLSEREEDHHFILWNGDVAHNKIPIGDEGGHDQG